MYANGQGVPQSYGEAVKWLRRAAALGSGDGEFKLGVLHERGLGVPQDYAEAVKWYRLAAEQGDDAARYSLGVMYFDGRGATQDHDEAAKWIKLAAQSNAKAQALLGFMYEKGRGVPQDLVEAANWFRRAAIQGDVDGQIRLGLAYLEGQGVSQSLAEATAWFQKAAVPRTPETRDVLGIGEAAEIAAPKTSGEAAAAGYRKAAEQNDPAAQKKLGEIYRRGLGVPTDHDEAIKWFRRAADLGDGSAELKARGLEALRSGIDHYFNDDYVAALSDLERALGVDPGLADANDLMGWIYGAEDGPPA